ncbi:MAG TPA: hypothetical protein VFD06_01385 [Candidatus Polarisedimenticolia bacterium]|nr:hypothetical protein [Candidatus Polarisedimenticolia bacterium]
MDVRRKHLLHAVMILLALAGYLFALNYRRDEVPRGLNNDVAEEGLRGIQLLEAKRLEVINAHGVNADGRHFGHSMETLYLYLVGFAAEVLGSTSLAVHATTWGFTLASIVLLCAVVRRLRPGMPVAIPLLLAVSSVWLFHYGRSGLRANTAPLFMLAFALALDSVERDERPRFWKATACGGILGAGLYGYTACRVLPVAFLLYVALSMLRGHGALRGLKIGSAVALGALVVSIPNLVYLAENGREFLTRGAYVLPAHLPDAARNLLHSLALPLFYPWYSKAVDATHHFDGVSFGLTVAGLRPIHPLIGLAIVAGVVQAWRLRRTPIVSLLFSIWTVSLLALGISGPSLTRFLIVLPVFLVVAALGIEPLLARPWTRRATVAALCLLAAAQASDYFVRLSRDPKSAREFAEAATDIGRRARALAGTDRQVLCIVAGDANVVHYLTYDGGRKVAIKEFWHRRPDPREIPFQRVAPEVILVERHPDLAFLHDAFLPLGRRETHPLFDEFFVDPAWDWQTLSLKEGPDSPLEKPVAGYRSDTAATTIQVIL